MKCKVRTYRLTGLSGKDFSKKEIQKQLSKGIELIWDKDIFFPIEYQKNLINDINRLLPYRHKEEVPTDIGLQWFEQCINNALSIWKIKYGLTLDNKSFGDAKKCGILIGDPLFDFY